MHHRDLAAPSRTTPKRGGRGPAKRRRRPPHLASAAHEALIYTPERRSGDSPSSRRRSGRRRVRNPTDTPAAAGRSRVTSDSPLSTVDGGRVIAVESCEKKLEGFSEDSVYEDTLSSPAWLPHICVLSVFTVLIATLLPKIIFIKQRT
jgi:hypothetical protein